MAHTPPCSTYIYIYIYTYTHEKAYVYVLHGVPPLLAAGPLYSFSLTHTLRQLLVTPGPWNVSPGPSKSNSSHMDDIFRDECFFKPRLPFILMVNVRSSHVTHFRAEKSEAWQANQVPAATPSGAAPGGQARSASLESLCPAVEGHRASSALPLSNSRCLQRSEAVLSFGTAIGAECPQRTQALNAPVPLLGGGGGGLCRNQRPVGVRLCTSPSTRRGQAESKDPMRKLEGHAQGERARAVFLGQSFWAQETFACTRSQLHSAAPSAPWVAGPGPHGGASACRGLQARHACTFQHLLLFLQNTEDDFSKPRLRTSPPRQVLTENSVALTIRIQEAPTGTSLLWHHLKPGASCFKTLQAPSDGHCWENWSSMWQWEQNGKISDGRGVSRLNSPLNYSHFSYPLPHPECQSCRTQCPTQPGNQKGSRVSVSFCIKIGSFVLS